VKVSEVFQVETLGVLGSLASVLNAITKTGVVLEHLSMLRSNPDRTLWEITVEIDESAHAELLGRLNALPAVRFVSWSTASSIGASAAGDSAHSAPENTHP
jgi:hypothetical protein